jgi:tRNA A-37 threonylcarbamoyl transferase component Bud32
VSIRRCFITQKSEKSSLKNRLISLIEKYLQRPSDLPAPFQSSRSTAVYRLSDPDLPSPLFMKIYSYKEVRQKIRGFFRNTFFGSSRAKREWINLHRLAKLEIPVPEPIALLEMRRFRVLHACAVVTTWLDHTTTLDRHLALTAAPARANTIQRLPHLVAAMHAAGYTDGDLHLRNLLVSIRPSTSDPSRSSAPGLWKIDSPAGRMSRSFRRRCHDLACLDVGGRRFLTRTDRLRFWRSYCQALPDPTPRARERIWLARIQRSVRELEPREGRRVDAVVRTLAEEARSQRG